MVVTISKVASNCHMKNALKYCPAGWGRFSHRWPSSADSYDKMKRLLDKTSTSHRRRTSSCAVKRYKDKDNE